MRPGRVKRFVAPQATLSTWLWCKTLQDVSSCGGDARRYGTQTNRIAAIKLEATPRYHYFRIRQQRRDSERILRPEEAPGLIWLQFNALTQDLAQLFATALGIAKEHSLKAIEHPQVVLAHVRHACRKRRGALCRLKASKFRLGRLQALGERRGRLEQPTR